MNRRQFLTNASAAPLSFAFGKAQAALETFCVPSERDAPSQALIQAEGNYEDLHTQYPVTLLGDARHTDPLPFLYVFSLQHIDLMERAGKKHLFLEVSSDLQGHFDDVAEGRVRNLNVILPWFNRRAGNKPYSVMSKGIALMHRKGIKVHCRDDTFRILGEDKRAAYFEMLQKKRPMDPSLTNEVMRVSADNDHRAESIMSAANGEPLSVFIGAFHLHHPETGLKAHIHVPCARADLYSTREAYDEIQGKICAYEGADMIYVIDEQKAYIPDPGFIARAPDAKGPSPGN